MAATVVAGFLIMGSTANVEGTFKMLSVRPDKIGVFPIIAYVSI